MQNLCVQIWSQHIRPQLVLPGMSINYEDIRWDLLNETVSRLVNVHQQMQQPSTDKNELLSVHGYTLLDPAQSGAVTSLLPFTELTTMVPVCSRSIQKTTSPSV
jgi:hypothetical protein